METVSKERIAKAVKHNLRLSKVPHSNPESPVNIIFSPKYVFKVEGKKYKPVIRREEDYIDYIKAFWNYVQYKRLKEGKKAFRRNTNPAVEFIIAFDKEARDFVNNPQNWEELDKRAKKFIKTLEEKFGIKAVVGVRHSDETTTHYHILFMNYSFKQGKTFTKVFKSKREFSQLQDLVAEAFKDLGFERGEKYDPNKHTHKQIHKSIWELHKELPKEIEQKRQELKALEELIEQRKKEAEALKELKRKKEQLEKEIEELKMIEARISERRKLLEKLLQEEEAKRSELEDLEEQIKRKRNTIKILEKRIKSTYEFGVQLTLTDVGERKLLKNLVEKVENLLKKYEKEVGVLSKRKEIRLTNDEFEEFLTQLMDHLEEELSPLFDLARINKWTFNQLEKAKQEERRYWKQQVDKLRKKLFELEDLDLENYELKATLKQLKQQFEDLQRKNEELNRLLKNLRSQLRQIGLDFDAEGNLREYEEPEPPSYGYGFRPKF